MGEAIQFWYENDPKSSLEASTFEVFQRPLLEPLAAGFVSKSREKTRDVPNSHWLINRGVWTTPWKTTGFYDDYQKDIIDPNFDDW